MNAPAAVLLLVAPIRMRSSSPRAEAVRRPSPTDRTSPCTPHAAARTRFTSVVCWRRSPASHGSGTFRRSASFTGQYAMRTEPQSLIWRRQYVVRRRRCCDHFVTTYVGMCLGVCGCVLRQHDKTKTPDRNDLKLGTVTYSPRHYVEAYQ